MEPNYELEELLPLVSWLTDKYTSKESTSVPYETANMLMEAILYTIREGMGDGPQKELLAGEKPGAPQLYEKGRECILQKCLRAKEIYEEVVSDFEDYGCMNYKDTVLLGIPEFFARYDPLFSPQDHLLTLDYPLLYQPQEASGIDLIYSWLSGVALERRFLSCFSKNQVRRILEREHPEYEELYLGNLCEPVLFYGLACFLADRPWDSSSLDEAACKAIENRFAGKGAGKIGQICEAAILWMLSGSLGAETAAYFAPIGKEFCSRFQVSLEMGTLRERFR